ncbi:MAG: hypothetical protein K8J08_10040, partial [Thermoanaerobaculia bacterium]|nr:hypothetical protein [Thermoanaerobaculia bacterium]
KSGGRPLVVVGGGRVMRISRLSASEYPEAGRAGDDPRPPPRGQDRARGAIQYGSGSFEVPSQEESDSP